MATFTYFRETGAYNCGERGMEYEGEEFDYSPEPEDLYAAVAELALREYFGDKWADDMHSKRSLKQFVDGMARLICDYDLIDSFVDDYYDDLKSWFEDEAFAYGADWD